MSKITLELQDGTKVEGKSFGSHRSANGEVVFNTAMNGYPENLTDPSYRGQLLIVTYPIVGNYGVPTSKIIDDIERHFESDHIHVRGLIINYYSDDYNHWNATKSLGDWLKENDIPGISGVDTRALTKKIREHGSMPGRLIVENDEISFEDPNHKNLVAEVSIKEPKTYGSGSKKVVLVDCGVKNNIIRSLVSKGVEVIRVPWDYDFTTIDYDGLFISNGPGDPKMCYTTITNIKKAFELKKPIFGICLGNQLLGLAAGGDTYKLKYGHRGYNQPVIKKGTSRAFITSQNHGFTLNEKLPLDWEVSYSNLNDDTCEGIKHKHLPFSSVQFHPEASGGPTDTEFLFDEFIELLNA